MPQLKRGQSNQDYRTPPALFATLHRIFAYTVDGAANHTNNLLANWWDDAFYDYALDPPKRRSWAKERVWLNPPFGNLEPFFQRAPEAELATILFPLESGGTDYFNRYPPRFLFIPKKRVNYLKPKEGEKKNINFGSALAFYGKVTRVQMKQVQKALPGTILQTV